MVDVQDHTVDAGSSPAFVPFHMLLACLGLLLCAPVVSRGGEAVSAWSLLGCEQLFVAGQYADAEVKLREMYSSCSRDRDGEQLQLCCRATALLGATLLRQSSGSPDKSAEAEQIFRQMVRDHPDYRGLLPSFYLDDSASALIDKLTEAAGVDVDVYCDPPNCLLYSGAPETTSFLGVVGPGGRHVMLVDTRPSALRAMLPCGKRSARWVDAPDVSGTPPGPVRVQFALPEGEDCGDSREFLTRLLAGCAILNVVVLVAGLIGG